MTEKKDDARVPTWNGDPAKFKQFRDRCEWYIAGLSDRDRKHGPSRIAQTLTDDAWDAIQELTPEDRSRLQAPEGLALLMEFLEDTIMDVPIPPTGAMSQLVIVK